MMKLSVDIESAVRLDVELDITQKEFDELNIWQQEAMIKGAIDEDDLRQDLLENIDIDDFEIIDDDED